MWDLPGPGLEPMSPALAARFLTTKPPGKSLKLFFSSSCLLNLYLYFKFFCNTKYIQGIYFCGFSPVILLLDFIFHLSFECHLSLFPSSAPFLGHSIFVWLPGSFLTLIMFNIGSYVLNSYLVWQSVSELSFPLMGSVCSLPSMLQFGSWMLLSSYVSLVWGHAGRGGEYSAGAENILFCGPRFCLPLLETAL